jgi:hypothetical protein
MEQVKFAFISDGDIFHHMTIPNNEDLQGVIAGLRSKPMIVEIPEDMSDKITPGLKYIDGQFIDTWAQPEDDYEVE